MNSAAQFEGIHEEAQTDPGLPVIHHLDEGPQSPGPPHHGRRPPVHDHSDPFNGGHHDSGDQHVPVAGLAQDGGQGVGRVETQQQEEDLCGDVLPGAVELLQELVRRRADDGAQSRPAEPRALSAEALLPAAAVCRATGVQGEGDAPLLPSFSPAAKKNCQQRAYKKWTAGRGITKTGLLGEPSMAEELKKRTSIHEQPHAEKGIQQTAAQCLPSLPSSVESHRLCELCWASPGIHYPASFWPPEPP